ncbi:DUF7344 domain-containing protein [Haloprofundus salinisoli]|uniref:DUF7344 domain-containing protein n=1 Tax=Haloprofundus salinisoli TaxID=2876193 RepID=UPI001CCB13A8|nr:hypothetical protein [Haloprofundus salinisoli]
MSSTPGYQSSRAGIGEPSSQFRGEMFEMLANDTRRAAVSVLLNEREAVPVRELASRVAERTFENPDASDRERVHVSLAHNHLPTLEAAEFVNYDSETVRVSSEFARYRCTVETVLSTTADRSCDDADEALEALADRRRRLVLAVLDSASSLPLDELAARVAERESDGDEKDNAARAEIRLALHHAHLPKLDALGFVRYDPETKTVERGEGDFVDCLGDTALPDVER